MFPVDGWPAREIVGVELELSLPVEFKFPEFVAMVGGLAAGTRRAGESNVNDPEAPRRGLLCMLPRGFDMPL